MSRDEASPWGEIRAVTTNGVTLDTAFAGPDDVAPAANGRGDAQANADIPILLLHGFPESREQWRPIVPAIAAAGHQVIAPNLRGYSPGARPEGAENYAISHLVDDVIGLLDALGLERVHLVGHDWGGIVAWFAAVRHPIRFASLTAVSTAHPHAVADALAADPEQRDAMQYIKHLRAPGAEDNLRDDDWFKLRRLAADLPPQQLAHHLELLAEPGALTGTLNYYRAFDPPRRRPTSAPAPSPPRTSGAPTTRPSAPPAPNAPPTTSPRPTASSVSTASATGSANTPPTTT